MKSFFSPLWAVFKVVLIKIGHVQARVILTVLYFILVIPTGFVVGLFSDLLGERRRSQNNNDGFWLDRQGYQQGDKKDTDIQEYSRRQY